MIKLTSAVMAKVEEDFTYYRVCFSILSFLTVPGSSPAAVAISASVNSVEFGLKQERHSSVWQQSKQLSPLDGGAGIHCQELGKISWFEGSTSFVIFAYSFFLFAVRCLL